MVQYDTHDFSSFFYIFRVDKNSDNLNFFRRNIRRRDFSLANLLEDKCEKIVIYVHFDL